MFQCVTLQQKLLDASAELQKCQEQILEKDHIISNLQHENQRLQDHISQLTKSPSQKAPEKRTLNRDVRILLAEEKKSGNKYFHDLNFDHLANKSVTETVHQNLEDVYRDNCRYSDKEIKDACRTYFINQRRNIKRKADGSDEQHKSSCRSRERKNVKLENRKTALKDDRVDLTPEERRLAQEMVDMGKACVSSEEDPSSDEDDPADRRKRKVTKRVRKVRELYFESQKMRDLKRKLDTGYWEVCASPFQKRQKWTIIKDSTCTISDRKIPHDVKPWMLKLDD